MFGCPAVVEVRERRGPRPVTAGRGPSRCRLICVRPAHVHADVKVVTKQDRPRRFASTRTVAGGGRRLSPRDQLELARKGLTMRQPSYQQHRPEGDLTPPFQNAPAEHPAEGFTLIVGVDERASLAVRLLCTVKRVSTVKATALVTQLPELGRHKPDETVRKLRDADAKLNAGHDLAVVLRKLEESEATYHPLRQQFGGMKTG